jgi:hypothetical protein
VSRYEWFTLQEIADLRGLTYGYVKRLASMHKWRKTTSKPRRYHIQDVIESMKSAE